MEEAAEGAVRGLREREDGAGHEELVRAHREAALGLVPEPVERDPLELCAQLRIRVRDDAVPVARLRQARNGLANLPNRPALEREVGRPDHGLVADRDRSQAEAAVALDLRMRRTEDRDAPAVLVRERAKIGQEVVELVLVPHWVAADERDAADDPVREERAPGRREEPALVTAEREEGEAVAAVRLHERAGSTVLRDGLNDGLRQRAEPEEQGREAEYERERERRLGDAFRNLGAVQLDAEPDGAARPERHEHREQRPDRKG